MKTVLLISLLSSTLYNCAVFGQPKDDTLVEQKKAMKAQQKTLAKQDSLFKQQAAALKLQQVAFAKQQLAEKEQTKLAKHQQVLAAQQEAQMKAQEKLKYALVQELLRDNLIKPNERYELIINSKEMFVNKVRQPDAIHEKYIKLINRERKIPFGEKEEWKINQ